MASLSVQIENVIIYCNVVDLTSLWRSYRKNIFSFNYYFPIFLSSSFKSNPKDSRDRESLQLVVANRRKKFYFVCFRINDLLNITDRETLELVWKKILLQLRA